MSNTEIATVLHFTYNLHKLHHIVYYSIPLINHLVTSLLYKYALQTYLLHKTMMDKNHSNSIHCNKCSQNTYSKITVRQSSSLSNSQNKTSTAKSSIYGINKYFLSNYQDT